MLDASFFEALLHVVAEAAPYLLFGFAAAGLLRALIPQERIFALLGRDSFRSVLVASLIGVPLPLCSCSVIPAAAGLRQNGAGRAATTSFLISTPETGVDSISITYALMDPVMTVIRPVAAFVTALFTGAAVGLLPPESTESRRTGEAIGGDPAAAPSEPAVTEAGGCCSDSGCGSTAAEPEPTRAEAVREGLRYAFGPLVDDLAIWLLIGFVLAAAVVAAVPDGFFAALPSGWISSLLMMVVATPVYICASAATPIAAALVLKGLDPGAALVFLLVGPATNATTILVVGRFLGRRVLAVYLVGVTVCALAFGAGVNALYAALALDPVAIIEATEHTGIGVVQALAGVALTGLLLYRVGQRVWSPPAAGSESEVTSVLR